MKCKVKGMVIWKSEEREMAFQSYSLCNFPVLDDKIAKETKDRYMKLCEDPNHNNKCLEFSFDQEFICTPTEGSTVKIGEYYFTVKQIAICEDCLEYLLEDKVTFNIDDYEYFKQWEVCCE